MAVADKIDDQTLALLVTLADLSGQNHGIPHILSVYESAVKKVHEYRKEKAPPFKYQGF
jgi:hypothetical protein